MARAVWAVACLFFVIPVVLPARGQAAWPEIQGGAQFERKETLQEKKAAQPSVPSDNTAKGGPVAAGKRDGASVAAKDNAVLPGVPQYRIGPEDQLRVSVWENKDLTLDVTVRPDGKISLPLIQDVPAEGRTAVELSEDVRTRLKSFINDPQVSVIVLQVNAPKYFIIGNVTKPGAYLLRSDTTLVQALSLAGGFTPYASPRSITVVHKSGGQQEVRKVNYYQAIDEGGKGNYLLQPGDTIVVP